MKRALEVSTALAAVVIVGGMAWGNPSPGLLVVAAFGAMIVLAENFDIQLHSGNVSITPGSMLMMAAIAVLSERTTTSSAIVGGALVAAFSGLYLPHLKARNVGIVAFNCGQYALAACAAGWVYSWGASAGDLTHVLAAAAAAATFGIVNIGLVLPYVALKHGERMRVVWADMYPAIPNYLSWGLLGLLVGLVCAELGALAIVLLALPMGIGRWTFRSFNRVKEAHDASVQLFIRLIEAKDPYTAGHTERVAKYSLYIAEELDVPAARVAHLRQSAHMHDVGKLAVPTRLLNKPGRLTPDEFDVVKRHNTAGIDILARIDFMRGMAVTASDRHGRFDHGDDDALPPELVLEAHIVAVADAFDAMTSTRSYRRALSQEVAYEELRKNAGTQFNPACVEALVAAFDRRGECYGDGYESDAHVFDVPPPEAGVGSAGLGDLEVATS